MSKSDLTIAALVPVTEAEGPGKRFAIWVQGCPFRCPGCCNPQYLSTQSDAAWVVSPSDLTEKILSYRDEIEGITFIGGEPFSQPNGLSEIAKTIRQEGLSVMVFSGFTLEQIENPSHPDAEGRRQLLAEIDLLVDGLYQKDLHVSDRRWIGSANQVVHFLTDRYRYLKDQWPREANTIEIRYKNGAVTINGFPHSEITQKSAQLLDP